jgi:UDP-glucose 4-epimerase
VKVLVTGGSGFIGSHVVDKLSAAGFEPRVFDRVPSPYLGDVDTVVGDVTDAEGVLSAMTGCDAVIHLAAIADVDDFEESPVSSEEVNTRGTLNVLEAAKRSSVKRVVYGSTTWIYSDCPDEAVDEETPVHAPAHLYTATKLAGELYCKAYAGLYGVDFTILRFGIPYGPRAREAAVIPAFVNRALAGEPLVIAGDGSQFRRFVYVEDLADGVVRALSPVAANRIYNLASDATVSIRELADEVRSQVADVEIVHTEGRSGDFAGKVISSERAEAELGWRATTPLPEGLMRYVEWRRLSSNGKKAGQPQKRVLILTADIGEGHDLPARVLAADLEAECPGIEVTIEDGLAAMGRLVQLLVRDGSAVTFKWMPWLFGIQYFLLMRFAPTRWLALRLLYLVGARRTLKLIRRHDPDSVVSTYPGTTALLGELRRHGRLMLPTFSAITDLAGLYFWAHPGVDLHFVTHPESIDEVRRVAGEDSVQWARPPTSPGFLLPLAKEDARKRLGLPVDGKVIVISGGGWGVGDLEGAVRRSLAVDDTTVVCICGHNDQLRERLERRFGAEPRAKIIGFTDHMSDLLAAADALVHSTAGLTVLEAIIRGCPVVSYGFAVGHVRLNNEALERYGLAEVAASRDELRSALVRALAKQAPPDPSFAALPSAASFVLRPQLRAKPLGVRRLRAARAATAAIAALGVMGWGLSTDDPYPLFAKTLDIHPITSVSGTGPATALVVDAHGQDASRVAAQLARRHARASFAFSTVPASDVLDALRSYGDEVMPRLQKGGLVRWLGTRGKLRGTAKKLGISGNFFYAVPPEGFTLGQYVLGHTAGATPVGAAVRFTLDTKATALRAGQVIELALDGNSDQTTALLDQLVSDLRERGLGASPVGTLVRGRSH